MKNTVWLAFGVLLLAGCASKAQPVAASTTTAPTVSTTSTVPPTTVLQPSAPQPSPDKAGSALIAAWQRGDKAAAQSVAAPAAVAALFAQPYPASGAQSRGCQQAVAGPSVCSYGIGGTSLLDLAAVAVPGGWIIDTAMFLGG